MLIILELYRVGHIRLKAMIELLDGRSRDLRNVFLFWIVTWIPHINQNPRCLCIIYFVFNRFQANRLLFFTRH